MNLNEMYQKMGIDNDVYTYGQKIAEELAPEGSMWRRAQKR